MAELEALATATGSIGDADGDGVTEPMAYVVAGAGMATQIVDLVETGTTLRANGLEPLEHIADISSRLIVNQASMKTKHDAVKQLIDRMAEAREHRNEAA